MTMLRRLRSQRSVISPARASTFDCFGICKIKKKRSREDRGRPSAATEFYKASLIPRFFRMMIRDEALNTLPVIVETTVVMMYWRLPELNDVVERYFESEAFVIRNLSQEINSFVQPILDLILAQGGDIVSFTDTCWQIIWNVVNDSSFVLSVAVELALYIQGNWKPNRFMHGLHLKHTFGIGFGNIKTCYLGDTTKIVRPYLVGNVIPESAAAVLLCEKGKVVLTPTAWKSMAKVQSQYQVETLRDGFIQISKSSEAALLYDNMKNNEHIELMEYLQDNDVCRRCIHPSAEAAITVQQLEILSSITHVCVGAVCVRDIDLDMLDLLQSVTLAVIECVMHYEGLLTKIQFRQTVFYGILFGHFGLKHDDDAVRALNFSNDIMRILSEMGISAIVRFATGTCFSGVVGGPHRMESIIVGKTVSATVHLCAYFSDIPIVCCINTFLRTRRVLGDIFTQVEQRSRGLINIPVCFEVNFSGRAPKVEIECFGREIEKDMMCTSLSKLLEGAYITENCLPLIIVSGSIGIGKTNFLKWTLEQACQLEFRFKCGICNFLFEDNFERAWYIAKSILVSGFFDAENKIIDLLGENAHKYPLHLLNQYLNTEFPVQIPLEKSQELQKDMLVELMRGCANGNPILIVLDDGEQIAVKTWMFLQDMLITGTAFVVVSFHELPKENSQLPFLNFILKQKFVTINLGPLEERDIVTLSCHYLNIVAIHKEFVRLLTEHCQGNPLLLQEILLLPQLQLHMCLVLHNSVVGSTLEESFFSIDFDDSEDKSNMKVCDVLDADGLKFVYIPKALLDVVKERTVGLPPQEQMLIKKCACLGERFGLYLLDAICPEYTIKNLRASVGKLIQKNILSIGCNHIDFEKPSKGYVSTSEIREEFCCHPLMFTSELFRQCVSNSMPKGQKERLHHFIISLLKDTRISCDSCRNVPGPQILIAHSLFDKDCFIPKLNFIHCQCINFILSAYCHIDFHLKEGQMDITYRIKFLLQAAELALLYGNDYPAESFLKTAQQIVDYNLFAPDKNFSPTLAKAAIKRLQAQSNIFLDETTEAMDGITQALMILGKVFPSYYLSVIQQQKREIVTREKKEEARCLAVGCRLLLALGKYKDAYVILNYLKSMYKKFAKTSKHDDKLPSFAHVLQLKTMLFAATCKTKSSRVMNKCLMDVIEICNKRLDGSKPVDTIQMKEIIRAYKALTTVLFESDNLEKASVVGNRLFQITKILRSTRELGKASKMLCLIYFYQKNFNKCSEMLSHLFDVVQQTGKVLPEAIYYSLTIKYLRGLDNPEVRKDRINMCNEFAQSRTPNMILTKSKSQKFWILSLMAVWCSERYLEDAFKKWHEGSLAIEKECTLTNYWSIAASLNMIIVNLNRVRETCFTYDSKQMSTVMDDVFKDLNRLGDCAIQFAPVVCEKILDIKMLIQTILIEKVNASM